MYKLTILDNGLKVITNRMVDIHSVSVGLWIKTGGRYETEKKQGLSHFMEHMLFKGTDKRSCQQLKQAIEQKGGVFNAFAAEEFVCYYVKILSEHLNLACDILSDMVLNPSLKNEEIEKERKVIIEEIRMYLDLPNQYVHDLLDELIWPDHPLGLPLLGTYDTVGSIVHSDLAGHKELFHRPNNIIAVCTGNVEHDCFVKTIDRFFKRHQPARPISFEKVKPAALKPRTRFYDKDTEQTHLCLGVRGPGRKHPERYALALLNIILGGNMSSRLFNEIREKRSLAYEIGSSVSQYSDTGSFFIHAGIDNKKIKEAIAVIMKELKKIKDSPVTRREFDMAREYYKSGLLMALEDSMTNMLFLGEQMASIDRIYTKDNILEELEGVDIDMVKRMAERLFTDRNLKLAVIGPQKEKERRQMEELLYF